MKSILFLFISTFIYTSVLSQPSDFIVVKKNQHTVKTFFAGSNISFETGSGYYSGEITSINKDSLFINQYDIRQIPTNLGIYVVDTVATYRLAFNYKDILKIERQKKRGFDWTSSGGNLLGGGILITAVGLGSWLFTKTGAESRASPALVISGVALAGAGYLLLRSNSAGYTIGKKYQLQYISVK
jgi:hypothetical protein